MISEGDQEGDRKIAFFLNWSGVTKVTKEVGNESYPPEGRKIVTRFA